MTITAWVGDPTGGDSLFSSRWRQSGPEGLRREVIARIYPSGFPTTGSDRQTLDTTDPLAAYSQTPSNLAQVDLHEFDVGGNAPGVTDVTKCWVFRPDEPNGKLIIQIFGHRHNDQSFEGSYGPLIKSMVEDGYTVAAIWMSEFQGNEGQAVSYHNTLSQVTDLQFFLDGPIRIINELADEGWDAIYGSGKSGGGWEMCVWGALDTRVTKLFSIAGWLPLYMEDVGGGSSRDWEQFLPGLDDIVDYTDLAALCAHPNREYHAWINDEDPSVFTAAAYNSYAPFADQVKELAQTLGGVFDFHIDDNNQHEYSAAAQAFVLSFFNGA